MPRETTNPRVRTPIDALLRVAMPDGLTFSRDADKRALIGRASFDLLGLPPTPEEVEHFLADQSTDAYERLIDRLLASPHYGERWARHWLDAAGYADSEGATAQDAVRNWSYKYRDYVIRAFNADKPLDRFMLEQLAGDELAGPIEGDLTSEQIEFLTATGFMRMAADGTASGDDSPEARNQVVADTLKIVTSSLLGVSVACAQCHDHRYDPVLQTDYYALRGVFEPALDWQAWKTPNERHISLYTAADRQRAAEIETEAQKIAAERAAKQTVYMAEALDKELTKFDEPLRGELHSAYQTAADQRTARKSSCSSSIQASTSPLASCISTIRRQPMTSRNSTSGSIRPERRSRPKSSCGPWLSPRVMSRKQNCFIAATIVSPSNQSLREPCRFAAPRAGVSSSPPRMPSYRPPVVV